MQLIEVGELNAYDVLCNETIVFTTDTLPTGTPGTSAAAPAAADAEAEVEVETAETEETEES